jgi:hypothetical protein
MPPKLKSSSHGAQKIGAYGATLESQTPSQHPLQTSHCKFEMSQKQGTFEGVATRNRCLEALEFEVLK